MTKVKVTGVRALNRAYRKYRNALGVAYKEGLDDATFRFIEENDDTVPIDTGALRNSGRAYQEGEGFTHTTVLGYGWEIEEIYLDEHGRIKIPKEYAAIKDEEYRFLEEGINTYLGLMLEVVADRMDGV